MGCRLNRAACGNSGVAGSFGFYGNKNLTSEAAWYYNDTRLADRWRLCKGQGGGHLERGFNYRMMSNCAAIGLPQPEYYRKFFSANHRSPATVICSRMHLWNFKRVPQGSKSGNGSLAYLCPRVTTEIRGRCFIVRNGR